MGATNAWLWYLGVRSKKKYTQNTYQAGSDALGVYLPNDKNQAASSTSLQEFSFEEDVQLLDVIQGPATGVIELIRAGNKTGYMINFAAQGPTNSGRPAQGAMLKAGVNYRWQVAVALAT